jgi:protocadherin alpha
MRPQKLRLKLRAGKPQQFTLNFRPSRNFPLDVYFLLDVTGSFSQRFRDTVTPLATELVSALQTISERYAVAFGGFGDKRAIPYALPNQDPRAYITNINSFGAPERCANQLITNVADCNPTISFRHTTALSPLTTDQLQQVLANISIHPNVDSLEGGMDGLVQVLTCPDTIGWRNQSLRMVLYMSNANFHLAGDGKVGAAIEPNPGECFLEQREVDGRTVYDYTKDRVYVRMYTRNSIGELHTK